MKLTGLEFIRLLPQFMREDSAVQGLSAGIDKIIRELAPKIPQLSTWGHIDELSEAELDALAKELNILWYDATADISAKREIIKNSDMVYKKLGTKWAVENVIETYFGEGNIKEWFEYDGKPGHFEVHSTNPSVSNEKVAEFLSLLSKVKRASAKLDSIIIELSGEFNLSAGFALHEISTESYLLCE